MKQDILIITRNFPPITGGMEKLMWHVFNNLSEHYRVTLIGPKGSADFVESPHRCVECNEESPTRFLLQAAIAAWRACRSTRFSCSIGGSGVVGPICRLLQIRYRLPSLLFLHGLDIVVDNFVYQRVFVPSLKTADLVICNSQNTRKIATLAGIDANKIRVIYPGTGVSVTDVQPVDLRKDYDLHESQIILSVGRLIKRKGVLPFIENCMPRIVSECPNTVLIVIGDEPTQALKQDGPVTERINAAIKQYGLDRHVLLLGKASDDVLFSAYQLATALVFPVIDLPGDVEGFGIVAVEAASFGVPTIAFRAGGVADAVIHNETGILVEPGKYEDMAATVVSGLKDSLKDRMRDRCLEHSKTLSWSAFGGHVLGTVRELGGE